MFCENCGVKNDDVAVVCSGCGKSLGATTSVAAPATTSAGQDITPATKACPYCGEQILAAAVRCKHCQASLTTPVPLGIAGGVSVQGPQFQGSTTQPTIVIQNVQTQQAPPPPVYHQIREIKNPTVALLCSVVFPGGGQFYNGHVGKGILVLCTFWLWLPYFWSLYDAYTCAKRINAVGY